jgi:chemotaxis protein MotB
VNTIPFAAPVAALLALSLAACVPVQQYDVLEQDYVQLQTQLSAEIAADQVEITKLEGQLRVTMKADLLFPSGGWQLEPKGENTLMKLVPTLEKLQNTRIVVNGYTDNVPIGPELRRMGVESNLQLSSNRADTVVQFLKRHDVNPNLLSAQGFGDTHPVASNDTPEGRAQNRRVDLTLVGPGT